MSEPDKDDKSRGIGLMGTFLGDGLVIAEGDLWLRERRPTRAASYGEEVAASAETMVVLERR